ncbi:GNAT family N-acetyltransferase [Streptomyces violascens]|uniref:GNAT family N-acetyltransferase n=1 Tax=Streptomyces violascens TaxID=67381 RepID=UPI0036BC8F48
MTEISTTVWPRTELGAVSGESWHVPSSALDPGRLAVADARWHSSFVVAEMNSQPVGLLVLNRCRSAAFPAPIYDPAKVAPQLFEARPADSHLLIGGSTELVSGYVTRTTLDESMRRRVGRALVAAAIQHAESLGLIPAALYVRDEQLAEFRKPSGQADRPAVKLDEFAELPVGGDYLSSLNHGRRSVVRRDWRRLEESGLRAVEEDPFAVMDETAELVAAVKERHDVPEHPRLAAMRLRRWAKEPLGRRLAFVVRDSAGGILAATYGCHYDHVLELYEIGLTQSPDRHLAYVESMIYGPRRYAVREGCSSIHLGLGASRPKDLRGAMFSPVWAVAAGALTRD